MVLVVFQSQHARANPPTGANEYNHALAAYGGLATASGSSGSTTPGMANDGSTSTYWQSSTTTGWLAVSFPMYAYLNVVHIHFYSTSKIYPQLSLYYDLNGNGVYETSEKLWSTISNNVLDVIINTAMKSTLGIKVTIDAKVGSSLPMIAEFEAYLQNDTDGDGLTNAQETSTVYYQDMGASSMPTAIPDDGVNASSNAVSLTPFYGNPVVALTNFTIDHTRKTDLTAQIGYWNGTGWVDRYVWDPGRHLDSVSITAPTANAYVTGTVTVIAAVLHPEITSKVEFRVGGTLQATVMTPVGSSYQWGWNTAGFAEGPTALNATQYDTAGGNAWSQITVNVVQPPATTWVSPTNGATVSNTVTVKVTTSDYYGISYVTFYVDGTYGGQVLAPNSGPNGYAWSWNTAQYCTNGQHTLKATVSAGGPLYLTTSLSVTVTTATYPLVCITSPTNGAYVKNTIGVVASPTAAPGKSITKVDFYLSGSFQYEATASPWAWTWDTTLTGNGVYTLSVIATQSDSAAAGASITVHVSNSGGGGCTSPPCPTGPSSPNGTAPETSPTGSPPTATLGVLTTDWNRGEVDANTKATIVVDLTDPASQASAAENASRIFRPAFSLSYFMTYPQWHLVVRDWVLGTAGNVIAFALRFEVRSDPNDADTDRDGIPDGTEVYRYHTLPVARDSDLDGLADSYEITPHSETVTANGATTILAPFTTDPTKWDSDNDGLSDGQERGFVSFGMTKVIGEVGVVHSLETSWTTVYLHNHYTAPVVLAEPTTMHNSVFEHVRIQGVTDHTFQLKVETWGSTASAGEDVPYLVLESGDHILPDGSAVEAGTATVGVTPSMITFREAFASTPYILVQTQTATSPTTPLIANRTAVAWPAAFGVRLNVNGSTAQPTETVGYVAIAPQAGPGSLATWTRAEVSFDAGHTQGTWTYPAAFSQAQAPLILAWVGAEPSSSTKNLGLRLKSATNASATIFREQYGTATADVVDFFAFTGPMNITARMTTKANGTGSADTDGDGLSDGVEANTYGSNPTLKDTDADGIPDNVEVSTRTATIPVNGTLKTITFTTSPTSADTDGDGVSDLDEINGILDHRSLYFDMQTLTAGQDFPNGLMTDFSGNGNWGTVSSSAAVSGKVGGAWSFNSSNTLQVPDSSTLDPDAVTVAAWIYLSASPNTIDPIVAKGQSGSDLQYYLDVHNNGTIQHPSWVLSAQIETATGATVTVNSKTAVATGAWSHVAMTYDYLTLRVYLNGALSNSANLAGALRSTSYALRIGGYLGTSSAFKGSIDEVQIWDRALAVDEIDQYAGPDLPVLRADFESRLASGSLYDFSGRGNSISVSGTTLLEGRSGFARSFAGGSDGVSVADSASLNFNSAGVTVGVYVNVPAYPSYLPTASASDVSLVAKQGEFYLNLSTDGLVRFTVYKSTTVTSLVPIALGRWVRVGATADGTTLSLYLDGILVASASGGKQADTSNPLTIGYATGGPHLAGSLDELIVYAKGETQAILNRSTIRGIQLNPAAADTDGDGLADGQETTVVTAKTPNRYPIPDYSLSYPSASTDILSWGISAPGWALASATAMVGITHPDMGDLSVYLDLNVPNVVWTSKLLRSSGSNGGQANNFTSYDLFKLGFQRSDFVSSAEQVYLQAYDNVGNGKIGQIEYLQLQIVVHTLPNRADTDKDGLNDSEEVNFGHDGYQTNPWKADTDSDGVTDGLEVNGWSWAGSTIVSDPNGFKTDPTRADTDRDGVPDGQDRVPTGDAFVDVLVYSITPVGTGASDGDTSFQPFASITVGGQTAYTDWVNVNPGSTAYILEDFVVNVDDASPTVSISIRAWDYDTRVDASGNHDDVHTPMAVATDTSYGGCSGVPTWTFTYPLGLPGGSYETDQSSGTCPGATYLRTDPIVVHTSTVIPLRTTAYLVTPGDDSGVVNITNAAGTITSRRYVGEAQLVALVLNVTSVDKFGTHHDPYVYLVPRSVFFDSLLYKDLSTANLVDPLGSLSFAVNSTASAKNSDALQEVLTGNVTSAQRDTILALLEENATGVVVHGLVPVTPIFYADALFLYSFPDDAIRLVAYEPSYSYAARSYRFCTTPNCQTLPTTLSIWVRIWNGIVNTVTGWIVSAIVIAATAFRVMLQVLGQIAAWLWTNVIAPAAAAVKSAVAAAAKVLGQLWDSFVQMITAPFKAFLAYLDNWKQSLINAAVQLSLQAARFDGSQASLSMLGAGIMQLLSAIFDPGILLMLGIAAAGIMAGLVASMATGIGYVIASTIGPTLISMVVAAVSQTLAPAIGAALNWLSSAIASSTWLQAGLATSIATLGLVLLKPFATAATIEETAWVTDESSFVYFEWAEVKMIQLPTVKSIVLSLLGVILAAIPLIQHLSGAESLFVDVPALCFGLIGWLTSEEDPAHPVFGEISDDLGLISSGMTALSVANDLARGSN